MKTKPHLIISKVDYSFYYNCYGGFSASSVSQEDFDKYEPRARFLLSQLCCVTEENARAYREELSLTVCAIADLLFEEERSGRLKAETIDGYSVTFREASTLSKTALSVASLYLGKTPLLYQGVE